MIEWMNGSNYTLCATLYASNITLNRPAASYFDEVRWVKIGLDRDLKIIVIKPIPKKDIDLKLVSLEQLHKISIGKGYGRICSKQVMSEIEQLIKEPLNGAKKEATFDEKEKLLIIKL